MNVSGGPDSASWKIRYDCDAGFELFGKADRECSDGKGGRKKEHGALRNSVGRIEKEAFLVVYVRVKQL